MNMSQSINLSETEDNMDKILIGIILSPFVAMLLFSFYHAGKEQHEAECIERARIMQQYNETTRAIICGTGGCKTE
jgi:hypothetical protein